LRLRGGWRRLAAMIPLLLSLAVVQATPAPPLPSDPIEADWAAIPDDELLVMQLKTGKRVVIRLAAAYAPQHVANIRRLAQARWWDGLSIYRVQENWVAQWGDRTETKQLPAGATDRPAAEFEIAAFEPAQRMTRPDPYSTESGITADGWPWRRTARRLGSRTATPVSASRATSCPRPVPARRSSRPSDSRHGGSIAITRW
jgi:peptidylprolyl isomerase